MIMMEYGWSISKSPKCYYNFYSILQELEGFTSPLFNEKRL